MGRPWWQTMGPQLQVRSNNYRLSDHARNQNGHERPWTKARTQSEQPAQQPLLFVQDVAITGGSLCFEGVCEVGVVCLTNIHIQIFLGGY